MTVKDEKEWMLQAESDMSAADTLFRGGKYVYAVFMCHLSVEKGLKAYCLFKNRKEPPKTHDLAFLIRASSLTLTEDLNEFLEGLSSLSVPTRYPEDLKRMTKDYNREKTLEIMNKSKDVLKCLKPLLNKR
jgi:HEPN domain-containing protein